ncbi:EAL domain protein [Legionella massiliensis]|uniref:EAL domain protein n=1 Tax=Legionella massiliensis TaxID=1034943 RepID=A0A078KWX7_9GAMM|nr:HDOD domain-containing protein [Legionella massiliensis]CDZ76279.1 EAL domain protein [Legionella massiliensis]CEE12017.1 EAL domain protein [Legionella massiliensis]
MKKQITSTLFARQAIYDSLNQVCAYELLYRAGDLFRANIDLSNEKAGDDATSFILSHLFTHLDINTIVGAHPAYINFTRNHLLKRIPTLLPKKKVIIELLENTVIDESLIESVKNLREDGYRLALDDFIFREELVPLVDLADVIKIEVLGLSKDEIKRQIAPLVGSKAKLLAEKIENRDQLLLCKELGFELFQGFFLNYPDLIHGNLLSENKTYLLKLFAEIYDVDVHMERVEEIILQIPKLSYQVLRLANSAALYKGKKIESLMDAIRQLGLIQIRNWLSLLLVSSLDDVAPDLLERTLIRAKMCQNLATISELANPHQAYTVGMLSTLDAILNETMPSLLGKIRLSDELNEALLKHQGALGYLLAMTQWFEQANFSKLDYEKFSPEDYNQAYLEGIAYASAVLEVAK